MNSQPRIELRSTAVLGVAAALLAAAAAWPWLAEPAALRPAAATAQPNGRGMTMAALPPLTSFAAIVDRPLFAPSRRPSASGTASAAVPVGLRYRLIGIVAVGRDRRALLADPGGPHPIEIGEGGTLDGWTVTHIEDDRILLSGPAGAAVLALRAGAATAPAKR